MLMEHLIIEKVVNFILQDNNESHLYEGIAKLWSSSITSKYGYGISAGTVISIIGGCIWVYMLVKQWWRSKTKPMLQRSKSLAQLYGGEFALERFFDYNEASAVPATLDNTDNLLKALLEEEHLDLKKLQSTVAKLEMTEKEATAVKLLKQARKKHENKPHQLYEIEMLLVEMLIYKGDFDEALACECLKHDEIADARRPLYKAVIHTMLGNLKEAKQFWEEFIDMRREFIDTRSVPLLQLVNIPSSTDFLDFSQRVNELHHKILEAAKSRKS